MFLVVYAVYNLIVGIKKRKKVNLIAGVIFLTLIIITIILNSSEYRYQILGYYTYEIINIITFISIVIGTILFMMSSIYNTKSIFVKVFLISVKILMLCIMFIWFVVYYCFLNEMYIKPRYQEFYNGNADTIMVNKNTLGMGGDLTEISFYSGNKLVGYKYRYDHLNIIPYYINELFLPGENIICFGSYVCLDTNKEEFVDYTYSISEGESFIIHYKKKYKINDILSFKNDSCNSAVKSINGYMYDMYIEDDTTFFCFSGDDINFTTPIAADYSEFYRIIDITKYEYGYEILSLWGSDNIQYLFKTVIDKNGLVMSNDNVSYAGNTDSDEYYWGNIEYLTKKDDNYYLAFEKANRNNYKSSYVVFYELNSNLEVINERRFDTNICFDYGWDDYKVTKNKIKISGKTCIKEEEKEIIIDYDFNQLQS